MDTFFRDLRYSVRMLIKSPAFTAVAVLSIALGIGANTTVFSVINAVLLKSLPYKEPSSLMLVWGNTEGEHGLKGRNQVSATDVADFRKQATVFEDVAAYTGWYPIMSGDSAAERMPAIQVGDGFFKIMKGKPLLGRVFTPEEQEDGKDRVIVLGYGLWQRRFGGDPTVIGRSISLNSRPYTIVGVMGPDFHPLPSTLVSPEGQFYRPVAEPYDESERDARHLRAIARLKPGVTVEQAQAEMNVIAQRLEREHPLTNKGQGAHVVSITDDTIGGVRPTLLMVFGAVIFVLLVACANVANLLLARSTARHKEITIRAAIGAGRGTTHKTAADREFTARAVRRRTRSFVCVVGNQHHRNGRRQRSIRCSMAFTLIFGRWLSRSVSQWSRPSFSALLRPCRYRNQTYLNRSKKVDGVEAPQPAATVFAAGW